MIKLKGVYKKIKHTAVSIAAGCTRSNGMARALTAHVLNKVRRRAYLMGCNNRITKTVPVSPEQEAAGTIAHTVGGPPSQTMMLEAISVKWGFGHRRI